MNIFKNKKILNDFRKVKVRNGVLID